jgi:hypothetical protein
VPGFLLIRSPRAFVAPERAVAAAERASGEADAATSGHVGECVVEGEWAQMQILHPPFEPDMPVTRAAIVKAA